MQPQTNITALPKRSRPIVKNIPIEKILELKKKDLTHAQIAELLGCDKSNVTQRLKPYRETIEGLERFKNNRGDVLAFNQMRLLKSITDAEIKKAPLGTKILGMCQLYDKERLERGQSTENISVKSIVHSLSNDRDDLAKKKAALLSYLDNPATMSSVNGSPDKGK